MRSNVFIMYSFRSVVLLLRILLPAVLVLALPVSGCVTMYEEPKTFSSQRSSLEKVERQVLPKIDTERLLAEDRIRIKQSQRPEPLRYGIVADVDFTLDNSGTSTTLPDGRLWRLRIQSPGVKNLSLGITRFDMPEGAKLWVYDPGHKQVQGPYTSRHRSRAGSLWTPLIQGDEIVVEVFMPAGMARPVIEIREVNQGYRGLRSSREKVGGVGGAEDTCNIDVICPAGNNWGAQKRAVGVYTYTHGGSNHVCSGTMLNNTQQDHRNYFLTANHCTVDAANAASVVVYWNFQSASCGTHGPGSTSNNQTGSTLRANWAGSDFRLLELSQPPDPAFNVFYAGWDATGTGTVPSSTGIHHPQGDVKAISVSNSAPTQSHYPPLPPSNAITHWQVYWDSGRTEMGSSGSCLFETTHGRCIGQLHGGLSDCRIPQQPDYYGMFSLSWNGGGTAATRLSDWLDPVHMSTLSLDGDTHITTVNGVRYDFQAAGEFVSLRDPNGLEIQTRMAPIATSFNPGPDPHDKLATCVSLNTAVAARMGKHRVSYQPNLAGVPDPSGMQLRVDGMLVTTLGPNGLSLGDGGRIAKTAATGGLQFEFPDGSVLFVTPNWWADQSKWYLNIDLTRPIAVDGVAPDSPPIGGIAGAITPDTWLPKLPDGKSMGPMPKSLHQRYVDLYQKFAEAWRVTDKSSLFDYAPNTSTDTFTLRSWPLENPPCVITTEAKPASRPMTTLTAEQKCRLVPDENARRNCIFDVSVTGESGFAKTYRLSKRIAANSTRITVSVNKVPTHMEQPETITVTVARVGRAGKGVPSGSVQLVVDGNKIGKPLRLDRNGQAIWKTASLNPGKRNVAVSYAPSKGSEFFPSTSALREYTLGEGHRPGAGK